MRYEGEVTGMSTDKIMSRLSEAKMALFKLDLKLKLGENRKAFEYEEPRRSENLKQKSGITRKHLEAIEVQSTASGFMDESIENDAAAIVDEISHVPNSEREIAFKCVSSYKACKAESESVEDRVLCAVALTICWAKQVMPLTG